MRIRYEFFYGYKRKRKRRKKKEEKEKRKDVMSVLYVTIDRDDINGVMCDVKS